MSSVKYKEERNINEKKKIFPERNSCQIQINQLANSIL